MHPRVGRRGGLRHHRFLNSLFFDCLLGAFLRLFVVRLLFAPVLLGGAGRNLFFPQRGQQVFQPLPVVGAHLFQPEQRQHRLAADVQEYLRADRLIRPLRSL